MSRIISKIISIIYGKGYKVVNLPADFLHQLGWENTKYLRASIDDNKIILEKIDD